jgi:AmmeMemoRadiSam system protein B
MIREPVVAGQFYPADPGVLLQAVKAYLEPSPDLVEAMAVVAPHAGYIYSGPVAGAVFGAARLPRCFVLLGPNHTGRGTLLGLSPSGTWRTPLGHATVDASLNQLLLKEIPGLSEDRASHAWEHSLEVQLPFLQARVPELRFAAICVGTGSYDVLESLGHGLARVVRSWPEPVLIVSSSDMNHYESAEVGSKKDHSAIERVLAVDPRGLYDVVHAKDISMCGFAPTVATLIACRDLGASAGQLIRYSNSGAASGDYDRVVGYAGMAVLKAAQSA